MSSSSSDITLSLLNRNIDIALTSLRSNPLKPAIIEGLTNQATIVLSSEIAKANPITTEKDAKELLEKFSFLQVTPMILLASTINRLAQEIERFRIHLNSISGGLDSVQLNRVLNRYNILVKQAHILRNLNHDDDRISNQLKPIYDKVSTIKASRMANVLRSFSDIPIGFKVLGGIALAYTCSNFPDFFINAAKVGACGLAAMVSYKALTKPSSGAVSYEQRAASSVAPILPSSISSSDPGLPRVSNPAIRGTLDLNSLQVSRVPRGPGSALLRAANVLGNCFFDPNVTPKKIDDYQSEAALSIYSTFASDGSREDARSLVREGKFISANILKRQKTNLNELIEFNGITKKPATLVTFQKLVEELQSVPKKPVGALLSKGGRALSIGCFADGRIVIFDATTSSFYNVAIKEAPALLQRLASEMPTADEMEICSVSKKVPIDPTSLEEIPENRIVKINGKIYDITSVIVDVLKTNNGQDVHHSFISTREFVDIFRKTAHYFQVSIYGLCRALLETSQHASLDMLRDDEARLRFLAEKASQESRVAGENSDAARNIRRRNEFCSARKRIINFRELIKHSPNFDVVKEYLEVLPSDETPPPHALPPLPLPGLGALVAPMIFRGPNGELIMIRLRMIA